MGRDFEVELETSLGESVASERIETLLQRALRRIRDATREAVSDHFEYKWCRNRIAHLEQIGDNQHAEMVAKRAANVHAHRCSKIAEVSHLARFLARLASVDFLIDEETAVTGLSLEDKSTISEVVAPCEWTTRGLKW